MSVPEKQNQKPYKVRCTKKYFLRKQSHFGMRLVETPVENPEPPKGGFDNIELLILAEIQKPFQQGFLLFLHRAVMLVDGFHPVDHPDPNQLLDYGGVGFRRVPEEEPAMVPGGCFIISAPC